MQRLIQRPIYRAIQSSLLTRPGGFNPASLFADGSIGVLYDNNDLTSFYLDAAGTTAATVNGLVGLQLDKSQGLVLGAEAFPTLDLTTWTSAADVSAKTATSFTTTGFGGVYTSISGWTNTKTYNIRLVGSTTVAFNVRNTDNVSGLVSIPVGAFDVTIKSPLLTQNSTSGMLYFQVDSAGTVSFTSLSVKELPGNHRYQATTGSKPVLRGTPTGSELFTAYGTPGAGWSVAGATGTATTASSALPTTTAATVGKHYRVTYTVTRSAGSVQLSFGGRTGVSRSAAGQYVEYFDNTTNTNVLTATGTSFTGTVRIDEVKDVSAGSVTAPYGLQFDGVDDFLQTASVNFTATDKMTVCHGVRKFSDAAAIVAELSADFNGNTGSFVVVAGLDAGNYWSGASRGNAAPTTGQGYGSTTAVGPETIVGSWTHDIAGDQTRMRKNGVLATSALAGDNDKGTGNFGNYPLYFGRRGGTSLPYNGLMYSSVCIGRLLTAAELANVERWVARKTGVTL